MLIFGLVNYKSIENDNVTVETVEDLLNLMIQI